MTPERIEALAERLADRLWSHMNCGCDIRPVIIEELTRHFAGDGDDGIDEAWLRSIGFSPKMYQGNLVLAMKLPSIVDHQWIETSPVTESRGLFYLRRWSDLYDDETPPDSVEVVAKTRSDVRRLCEALGIELTP